ENLEAGVMAVWIFGAFVKITVFFYAVVLGTAQWLSLSDYKPVVFPIGVLIVLLSFWGIPNEMTNVLYVNTIFPFYSTIVQLLITLWFLIIVVIWRKRRYIR